jgi:glycosyltransferase involved in cell wall biosynthesis
VNRLPLRYVFRNSSLVFASSKADFPILDAMSVKKDRVVIVPNGVSEDFFEDRSEKELNDLRIIYGIPRDSLLILHLAQMKYNKGADTLIEAFKIIKNEVEQECSLVIAGPIVMPEFYEKVRGLCTEYELDENVFFLESIPYEHVIRIHQMADIFVLPSSFDTFPLSVLEALSKATPVIGANVGGIPYQIGDEAGMVIPSNDANELAKALKELIDNEDMRMRMSEAAYSRFKKYFTWDKVAIQGLEAYKTILEG